MPRAWPLVGRVEELEFIERAIRRGSGVVLAGGAGVGKTRLVAEALATAREAGLEVARAQGLQAGRAIPFGALAHLLPEELPAAPAIPNLIRAAARALVERAEGLPLVLAVDDAHHLDDHSAALLHALASSRQAAVVVTVRTGEPAPDPVVLLWKDGHCERLEVAALEREQVAELLEAVLGDPVEATTLHRLFEATRGNPLYLRELVLAGVESGVLKRRKGVWRSSGPLAMSPWLTELIEARLAGLDASQRGVLEVVAAAEVLEVGLLQGVASPQPLADLERRGLVDEVPDRRRVVVRLAHPLHAEALRASTPRARARAISKGLADALEATGLRRREDLLRLATWRLESGDVGSPDLLAEAAGRALGMLDHRLAERLARAAVGAAGGVEAELLVAESLVRQGRLEEADAELQRIAATAPDEVSRGAAVFTRAQTLFWGLGNAAGAVRVLDEAERAARIPAVRQQIAAGRAFFLFYQGRTGEAMEQAERILSRPDASPGAAFLALEPYANGLWMRGRPSEALALVERRKSDWDEGARQIPVMEAVVLPMLRMYCAHGTGDVAAMVRAWDEIDREAVARGADWLHALWAFASGWAARFQGTPRTAARLLRESIALMREADVAGYIGPACAELAHSLAMVGDVAGAEEALREARAAAAPGVLLLRAHVGLAGAWTAAARGETTRGIDLALEEAEAADGMGNHFYEVWALHDAARLGAARRVSDRIARLAAGMEGPLAAAYSMHATALACGDAPRLEAASEAFEGLSLWLLAAEAADEAGQAHDRRGQRGRGVVARARAESLAARCEGARTPAVAELEGRLPLTRRQREIAALAASGLSNREIARRLVVSVRTVDNHLHAIYGKLGVSGRQELRAILERVLPQGVATASGGGDGGP